MAQRRGDRIAVHGEQRQAQPERRQQRLRVERGADDDRVEAGSVGSRPRLRRRPSLASRERSASSVHRRPAGRVSRLPAGAKRSTWRGSESRAGALGLVAQQVRELAAIADLVVLRVDPAVQRRLRVQARLDRAAAGGIEDGRKRRRARSAARHRPRRGQRRAALRNSTR